MPKKFHIKKGDQVMIIAGVEKSREGKILAIDRDKTRAFVEGLNMVSKHTKPNPQYPEGGIIKKEASIHISNLMVIDGKGNATRIGRRRNKDGKLERYSKKTEETIK